jgi:hypothetical protein
MRFSVLAFGLFAAQAAIAPALAADLTEADLAALRYFLSINDGASSEAEIARLEAEFPGADVRSMLARIDEIANEVDTGPIWRRIEAAEFAAARELIAEIRDDDPSWTPPADMMKILDSNEGQARFEAAFAERDLAAASAALAEFPLIVTCERINNPWRLAELQQEAEKIQDALATYDGILRTCSAEDYVVATLQKASEIAEPDALAALFDVAEAKAPTLEARLETLAVELMSDGSGQEQEASGAGAGSGTSAPKAARAAAPAAASGSGPDSGSGADSGSGSGQASRARAAADRGDWSACLELTSGARSLDMLNQRSWCALNFGRPNEALQGFNRVASAGGSSMSRDATYGMILAYAKLGQLQQAANLATRASLTGQQRRVVNQTVISKAALQSFEAGQYRTTLTYLDRLSRESGLDRGLSMLRGWALLKSGRKGQAQEQFRRVHQSSPGKDSQRGLIESR